jgi:hypothetical protein
MTHPPSVCYTVASKLEVIGSMSHSEQDIWLRRFNQENVQIVVLSIREDSELVEALRRQPGWSADFEGDGAAIFARSAQKGKGQ